MFLSKFSNKKNFKAADNKKIKSVLIKLFSNILQYIHGNYLNT